MDVKEMEAMQYKLKAAGELRDRIEYLERRACDLDNSAPFEIIENSNGAFLSFAGSATPLMKLTFDPPDTVLELAADVRALIMNYIRAEINVLNSKFDRL